MVIGEGVTEKDSTKYAWEHIRDQIDLCAVFLTSQSIEITPFLPPVHLLKFMTGKTQRIYLSATVQGEPDFIRTFGLTNGERIEPETRAGESERLIVTPYVNSPLSDELFQHILDYSSKNKVLVIPNSEKRAGRWRLHETSFSSTDFSVRVNEFKAMRSGLLVAPARFEGMDFPNDTCRTLVIDGLPSGTGLLEKFLWNYLGEVKFLQGTIASRIVQSLGRISRGNDDYGVVFLLGNDLADWITRKTNRERIPSYIRAQLDLGERVTEGLASIDDLKLLERSLLERQPGWIELHQEEVKDASLISERESEYAPDYVDQEKKVAIAERLFIKHLWERDYLKAARALEPILDPLFESDKGLAAWHAHWIGFCYLKAENTAIANQYFNRAAKCFKALGVIPSEKSKVCSSTLIPDDETQVGRILKMLVDRGEINYGTFSYMDSKLSALSHAANISSNAYEESLRWLGLYLGFQSNRPDSESGIGRGPDNFWLSDEVAIMVESKTDKTGKAPYSKKEIGQCHNHLAWIAEEYPDAEFEWKLMIAGPDIEADFSSSPTADMIVWLPEEILELSSRIRNLLFDTWKESTPVTLYSDLERNLNEAKLTHKDILNSLPLRSVRKSIQS